MKGAWHVGVSIYAAVGNTCAWCHKFGRDKERVCACLVCVRATKKTQKGRITAHKTEQKQNQKGDDETQRRRYRDGESET